MKKILIGLVISGLLMLNASELESHSKKHITESSVYIATKAMYTLGSTVQEETSTLDGGTGEGLAVDVGYRVGNGFSVEVDGTFAEDTILETKLNGEQKNMSASYVTTSLDVAYMYHANHELGLFVKGGYEYEFEKIADLNVDAINSGFIYAAGTEYEVSETMAVIGEYEVTTIKGPRGNTLFLGMVYSF